MRHLKKFEELNLDTYINAGEMLKKSGHADRGQKLIDWAKRGQLDDTPDVNLWIKWMNSYPAQRGSRTTNQTERKEILKGLISDVPIKAKVQMVHVNLDILKDDIDYHKEQNGYPIIIGTVFIIDQSELEKIKPEYLNLFKGEAELSGTSYKIWPMELSSSFKLDENGNVSQVFPITTFTYGEIGSIFSDRRSANNFKNTLRKILTNEIKIYTGYKDEDDGQFMTNSEAMFQILTKEIPTIEISDIEMIIDTFKNINTNTLYSENSLEASKRIYQ
jgi:hypothetical protein